MAASPRTVPAAAAGALTVTSEARHEAAYRFVLAKMLASEGDFAAAGVAFREAVELAPDAPIVRLEYASHLIRLAAASRGARRSELRQQAREEAELARAQAGDAPAVWRSLADVYYDLSPDDPALEERAREALEKVVAGDPDDLEASLTLGQIYLGERQPERAVDLLQRVVEHTSGNRVVYSMLGEALVRSGRSAEAEGVFERLLSLDPTSRPVRLGLAAMKSERGDHEGALQALEEAPPGLRQQAEVRRRIALELLYSDEPGEARDIVDDLYAADPESPQVMATRALVLAAQGDHAALDALVADLAPGDSRRRELAALLQQQGETEEAERLLRQTLAGLDELSGEPARQTAAGVRFQLADLLGERGDDRRRGGDRRAAHPPWRRRRAAPGHPGLRRAAQPGRRERRRARPSAPPRPAARGGAAGLGHDRRGAAARRP